MLHPGSVRPTVKRKGEQTEVSGVSAMLHANKSTLAYSAKSDEIPRVAPWLDPRQRKSFVKAPDQSMTTRQLSMQLDQLKDILMLGTFDVHHSCSLLRSHPKT